jgi:hypothetical protein
VTVITSGGRVVTVTTAAGVVTLIIVMSSVYADVVVVVSVTYSVEAEVMVFVIVMTSVASEVAVVVVVSSEYEGAGVDSIDVIVEEGAEGVSVMLITMVVGISNAVTTIVDSNVDNCVSVTGGRVDAGSVTVVGAAAPVEPPSTGTTE